MLFHPAELLSLNKLVIMRQSGELLVDENSLSYLRTNKSHFWIVFH